MTGILKLDNRLCCVWRGEEESTVNCLVYGDKRLRTYLPNRIDWRLRGFPVLRNAFALVRHLKETAQPCLAPVVLCRRLFGWTEEDFADAA